MAKAIVIADRGVVMPAPPVLDCLECDACPDVSYSLSGQLQFWSAFLDARIISATVQLENVLGGFCRQTFVSATGSCRLVPINGDPEIDWPCGVMLQSSKLECYLSRSPFNLTGVDSFAIQAGNPSGGFCYASTTGPCATGVFPHAGSGSFTFCQDSPGGTPDRPSHAGSLSIL